MSRDQLHQALEALRAALAEFGSGDAEKRARIEGLIAALERQIDAPEGSATDAELNAELPTLVEHFEVEHPRLTAILNDLMVTLSGMGI
ncbi:MAG: DUF4404 family protein [Gammaproteobacteria bacterium]|nr:DUF4404 family protein [Gammaproteobacteria bacterium]